MGKGEGWVRGRQGRDEAMRGVREMTGKRRGYDLLYNSQMLAGVCDSGESELIIRHACFCFFRKMLTEI